MPQDILIHDATVLTVDEKNRLYRNGTVVVDEGTIREVRPSEPGDADAVAETVIDGSGRLVMPGLVNAHAHLELTALTGAFSEMSAGELFAEMTAVCERLGRGEYEYLVEAGCDLAALNFIRGGITTTNAMEALPSRGASAFGEAGLRGFFGPWISDLFWDIPEDEQFERARSFIEEYHGAYDGRIRATVCPHDDWSCSRDVWERTASLATEYPDLPVHTHLLELDASNTMARANDADDSLALLDEVGLLNERLVAAHVRVADEDDVERMAANDASVVHCPSIFCYWEPDGETDWTPVPSLREAGTTVGLGLDDHYWHDSSDLLGEARQTRLAANLSFGTNQFESMELVRMLTIEGARALGVEDELGSIEPGKRADLVVLDLSDPKFAPKTNVPALVANTATAGDVESTIVDGELLMHDHEVRSMDTRTVCEGAESAVERFMEDSDWEMDVGGANPPNHLRTVLDLPKRGPAHLVARLGLQRIKDRL
ncbi:5-methylthioadenosine/S-adenosylhomocysteine deaminase [Halopelagius inordinatus]|uniref:5-methylthioadenosine/S-adenosylhomocysteine deaminase n=1 Tax=Halopelagius inordinatus TaxID=553467 RepID=A0A1I2WY45_9EURY|nr:amidohydrolase family protein [Halopelagius inordinatus]SFH06195.1 5-methylthioadenosine/S-adenosylhomocysteine deaminase [Halopelagius inordinatus]